MTFDQTDTTCKDKPRSSVLRGPLNAYKGLVLMVSPPTGTLATPCTWCVVETACGVICACLPTLRPLAKRMSNKFSNSSGRTGKSATGQSRGPTELVTIGGGGGGGSAHMQSRSMTKSPFQRLDDDLRDTHAAYNNTKEAKYGRNPSATVNSAEYESSGDGSSVDDARAQRLRTNSHGQEQFGKGFV